MDFYCIVCGKGPKEGVTLYRLNDKTHPTRWVCRQHKLGKPDTELEKLITILEEG